uniref:Uncharacterized protein n=1 Tax=Lepeophtheirus salmonis TaxID=72036 RepID=A0A0K2V1M2_LEPSM
MKSLVKEIKGLIWENDGAMDALPRGRSASSRSDFRGSGGFPPLFHITIIRNTTTAAISYEILCMRSGVTNGVFLEEEPIRGAATNTTIT